MEKNGQVDPNNVFCECGQKAIVTEKESGEQVIKCAECRGKETEMVYEPADNDGLGFVNVSQRRSGPTSLN